MVIIPVNALLIITLVALTVVTSMLLKDLDVLVNLSLNLVQTLGAVITVI